MTDFVLNRNEVLSGYGHMINFKKGEPVHVPPELVKGAIAMGAEPVDGDADRFFKEQAAEPTPLTADEKAALMKEAFEIIYAENSAGDFDGAGKPSVEALKRHLDFPFSKKERDTQWQKFRELKAIEAA